MGGKEEKLKLQLDRHEKKMLEHARKAQAKKKLLSEIERDADTLRKILDGAHMQTEALTNPDIAALLQRLREEKLIRDRDREVFGLPKLTDAELQARGLSIAKVGRRKAQVPAMELLKQAADTATPVKAEQAAE